MYQVLCDNLPLFDLRDEELVLNSPKVDLKENNAGSFEFTIFPTHPYYDRIQKMKSVIQVMDNEDEIFCGRVIDESVDFRNRKKVTCEGELGYFNDSIQRPAVYHNQTVRGYLQTLINVHNAQIAELHLGIKFNAECAGESASFDYASLYYVKNNQIYSAFTRKRANDLAGKTFVIPSTEFYLYWHTDISVNNYFGIAIDSVEITDATAIIGNKASLPNYTAQDVSDVTEIETAHSPYENGSNLLWHYAHTIPSNYTVGKMFALGTVTVVDNNDSLYKYTNWETTMAVIKSDLLDTYGGHLRIRKVNGIRYLDYLQDYPNTNTQVIEFGQNLLDFTKDIDATDIATAVIPLGARLEESSIEGLEERLTIKSVNNDCDFIYSESAVNTYGWIYRTVTFDDVNVPANLKTKGEEYLKDIQFESVTLEVKAVDLHMMDVNIERIKMLDEIRVVSEPNGLDRFFPVTKMTIYLDSPSKNTITLGQSVSNGMTGSASSANAEIMKKINEIPSSDSIVKQAVDNATSLIHSVLNGHVVITENADELLIMDTDDIETARKVWRWNLNGLGYSSTGYNGQYATAITMDGQIVGDKLVGGSVSAEKLDVSYKTSVEKKISDAQENAEGYTDDQLKSYWTKTEVETAIKNTGDAVLLSAKETATAYTDNKLKNYSTSAQIKVTTDAITSEVNKKLNASEFSTKIQQNATSVKIAWNNISKYIQFESGELRIYDSANESSQKLVSKFNYNGEHFYRDGVYLGKIGTNNWSGDSSFRGIVFDLEYSASYMCWASKESANASTYTTKLIYYQNNDKAKKGLHFTCSTYANGNLYLTDSCRFINYSGGGVGYNGKMGWVNNSHTTSVEIDGVNKSFKVFSNVDIEFYATLNLNGWGYTNNSDARLKSNIRPTQIQGLEVINSIDLKEFDWIQTGEHQYIGIIAQQLMNKAPELIQEDSNNGRLMLKTDKLVYYCIKAIQELCEHFGMQFDKTEWNDPFTMLEKKAFCAKLDSGTATDEIPIIYKAPEFPIKK